MEMAAACGQPVEVLSARTEWNTVRALPSGEFRLESMAAATRTRVNGDWEPVDTTVVIGPDGVPAPVAPAVEMSFSSGGDEPLARITRDGHELALSWAGPLPAPVVSGSTVTYPSVLPDVDLVVSVDADGTGFSEVLVVKTAAAAANPALAEISFPVQVSEELAVVDDGGGFAAVSDAGEQMFVSPTPLMWDSSGGIAGQELAAVAALEVDSPVVDVPAPRVEHPLDGDAIATMPAELSADAVTITPDQGLLSDPDTVWPVFIDPTIDSGDGVTRNDWTMIQSCCGGDDADWQFSGDEGSGRCEVSVESSCNYNNTKRLVWEFGLPSVVRGTKVTSAEFQAYQATAYDCDTGWTRAYSTGWITTGTTWNNFHAQMDGDSSDPALLDSKDETRRSGCSLGPGWTVWSVTSGVQAAADASQTYVGLGVRSANETSMSASWKRFRYDAKLSITYNSYPNTPGTPSLDMSQASGSGPSGFVTRDSTPSLYATVSDDDSGQTVRGIFQIYLAGGSTLVWEGESWLYASGTNVTHHDPTPVLAQGQLYTVRVWAKDNGGLTSKSWSPFIQFKVDTVAPNVAPAVSTVAGQPATYVEDGWAGGTGQLGKFSFTNGGVTDVVKYQYSFGSASFNNEALLSGGANGDSVDISFTPNSVGAQTLYVRSVDAAGWTSPQRLYRFNVNTAAKAGWWKLNEGTGTLSQDGTTNNNDATLTPTGASWTDGPVGLDTPDKALRLDGLAGGATTVGPVAKTNASFTVTALVLTNGATGGRVAVSQDGVNTSGFKLGQLADATYCPAATGPTCWAFWLGNDDTAATSHTRAIPTVDPSRDAIAADTWTSLIGVYDATAQQIRLYVNGELAGTAPYTVDWAATGKLRIGHARHNGADQYFWSGDLDDVRIYPAALDEETIRRISQGSQDPADIPQ